MTTRKNIITACFVALLALGLAACGGSSSRPTVEPPGEQDDLTAAREAAMTAAEAAKTAWQAARDAFAGLAGMQAHNPMAYAQAQNALSDAMTAYETAKAAAEAAVAAATSAEARRQQGIAVAEQAKAEAANAEAMRYAALVMASMPPTPTDRSPSFGAMAGEARTWNDAEPVNLTVPAAEGGDGTLSYSATGLPAGVSFDPLTRTLSGTPAIGSGTITITVTDMDADGDHDTDTYTIAWVVRPGLMLGSGLHPSDTPPVYAETASSTLARLVADGANSFSPLSAAITRDFGAGATTVSSAGPHVKDIRGDGANGFHVTFVAEDGEEVAVHFTAADLEDQYSYAVTDDEGDQYWLWTYTANRATGRNDFRYLEVDGASGVGAQRFWFVFGTRTPAPALANGRASYEGRFRADSYRADNPSSAQRQRLWGDMRIVANFDLGSLEGDIDGIQGTKPGAPSSSRTSWPTSSFRIRGGKIVNGQFTATLTGHDSDPNTSFGQSVSGYVGALLGEFYGPSAEEVGAVLTATRDAADDTHDRVLQGHVAGARTLDFFADTEPFSTGVDRHDYATTPRITSQDADNRVTAITGVARDAGLEYTITYLVDGDSRVVTLGPEDLDGLQSVDAPGHYYRRDGSVSHYFNPSEGAYSFLGWWFYTDFGDSTAESPESSTAGHVVAGLRTAPADMPEAGGATYTGRAWAYGWEPRPANPSVFAATEYRGTLNLSANFAAGSIAGEIDDLESRTGGGGVDYSSISGRFAIHNGRIRENELSGDLSGLGYRGGIRGAFYGPQAAEAAGVFEATDTTGKLLHGGFRSDKQ